MRDAPPVLVTLLVVLPLALAGCAGSPEDEPPALEEGLSGGEPGSTPPAKERRAPDGRFLGEGRALFLLVENAVTVTAEGDGRIGGETGPHCANVTYATEPPEVVLRQLTPGVPSGVLVRDWDLERARESDFGSIDDGVLVVAFDRAGAEIRLRGTVDVERTLAIVSIEPGGVRVDGAPLAEGATRDVAREYEVVRDGERFRVEETLRVTRVGEARVVAHEPHGYCD